MAPLEVRRSAAGDVEACVAIVEGLPEYFTDDVPAKVARQLVDDDGWVAADADGVVALCVVGRRGLLAAEVDWLAVRADRRGAGVGTALLEHVLASLRAEGVVVVEAKTLDASSGYPPYVATRAFWARRGFVQVDTIDPLPGWQPGSPAAILVASLGTTVSPAP